MYIHKYFSVYSALLNHFFINEPISNNNKGMILNCNKQ